MMVKSDNSAEAVLWKAAQKHFRKPKKLNLTLESIAGTLNNLQYQSALAIVPREEIVGIKARM